MRTTYVALLRGVNVAGHGKLKMEELRQLFRGLGHQDVSTYIQSGNVIFTSDSPVLAADIEGAIRSTFGMDVIVVLRTRAQMEGVVRSDPFGPNADLSKIHVGFMADVPSAVLMERLDARRFAPERVRIDGTESYFYLPNGVGRAKLLDYVNRQLEVPITIRNWRTVTKLAALAAD
jgi:uncharacterized protein (DUF1697 family)